MDVARLQAAILARYPDAKIDQHDDQHHVYMRSPRIPPDPWLAQQINDDWIVEQYTTEDRILVVTGTNLISGERLHSAVQM